MTTKGKGIAKKLVVAMKVLAAGMAIAFAAQAETLDNCSVGSCMPKAARKKLAFSVETAKLATSPKKFTAGESVTLKIGVTSSSSGLKFSAKNLPNGLSISKKTGKISGRPQKSGSFTATVTVTDTSGKSISQKVKIKVVVPPWAVGTFVGLMGQYEGSNADWWEDGTVKFAVTSAGKISGKYVLSGDATSFSGSGFKTGGDWEDGAGTLKATVSDKGGNKFTVTISSLEYYDGYMRGKAKFKGSFKEDETKFTNKSFCIDQVMWTHPKRSKLPLPPIAEGLAVSGKWVGTGKSVSLKFGRKGAVTAVYNKAHTCSTSVSALSYDEEEDVWTAQVNMVFPKNKSKKFDGLVLTAVLEIDSSGAVVDKDFFYAWDYLSLLN
ncbi:MAG: putative Ig domain-containing protein [Kiritimatiellae bacterium]|nr:putative Ig domain-containing protein [Kiritimatiellia bacterium]